MKIEPKLNKWASDTEIYMWGVIGNANYSEPTKMKAMNDLNLNLLKVGCGSGFTVMLNDLTPNEDNLKIVEGHVFESVQMNFPIRCICCKKFVFSKFLKTTWKCKRSFLSSFFSLPPFTFF